LGPILWTIWIDLNIRRGGCFHDRACATGKPKYYSLELFDFILIG
jgi:hypothetical protein